MADRIQDKLIIFTRYPEPGKAKTRFIPALGEEGAEDLHRSLTKHTLKTARDFESNAQAFTEICFEGGTIQLMQEWIGRDVFCYPQSNGNLGDRMYQAFRDAFDNGAERVVIIGIDCPELTQKHLAEAFDTLDANDIVLGPAFDGGYYLIGLSNKISTDSYSALFKGITWGQSDVLDKTIKIADRLHFSCAKIQQLHDIDTPDDLFVLERFDIFRDAVSSGEKISVIIPVLNEPERIETTLSQLGNSTNIEIIVVDGGSPDDAVKSMVAKKATVISSPPGRARQLNAGAEAATGGIVLFLHADTQLPDRFESIVRKTLCASDVACGAFSLGIRSQSGFLRLIERTANWRSRVLQMPYGDQALFMRTETFRNVGGFPDQQFMEDFEFVRRVRKKGKVALVPERVTTSSRRWEARGYLRTTLLNQAIILSYFCGVSPARLHRWYYGKRM